MLFLRNRPSFSADSRLYGFLPLCSRFLRLVFSYSNFTFLNIRPLRSTLLPGMLSRKSKRRPVHLTSPNYCSKFRLHPVTPSSSKILVANSPSLQAAANCGWVKTKCAWNYNAPLGPDVAFCAPPTKGALRFSCFLVRRTATVLLKNHLRCCWRSTQLVRFRY